MNNWKYRIELGEQFRERQEDEIFLSDFAKSFVDKLEPILENIEVRYPDRFDELDEIVFDFNDYAVCLCEDVDEFDAILERLYDFGDEDKILLVDTSC